MTYNVFTGTLNPTHFTSLLSRAAQGYKVLSVIRDLYCAVIDVHKGSIYTFCQNCHSFFKLATFEIHSWKELSKTILMV